MDSIGFYHNDGNNCAFLDGHAKWVSGDDICWTELTDFLPVHPEGPGDPVSVDYFGFWTGSDSGWYYYGPSYSKT